MLDGQSRIDALVKQAAEDGQPALAITDHGNMSGIAALYEACNEHGVKPIPGIEFYMAYEDVDDRPKKKSSKGSDDSGGDSEEGRKMYFHMIGLAENEVGYKNLMQLSYRSFVEGYYYKPRIDWDMLSDHAEGIIGTSGCLGGHVLQHIMKKEHQKALETAARFQDILGRDNFFIEVQDHGLPEQIATNPELVRIARKLNAPLLATNDSHYTHKGDHKAHDAMLAVQTGALMSDPDRFKFDGEEHYLKSSAEMRGLFESFPGAVDNSLWIAERVNVPMEFGVDHLPQFPVPEGFESDVEYLRHLTFEGIKGREIVDSRHDEYMDRLSYELGVIERMGFSSYFLITWDLVMHARNNNIIVGPGRGSAGGSAVAYALQITDLDPIKHDLLFERFLNPSRISMPDSFVYPLSFDEVEVDNNSGHNMRSLFDGYTTDQGYVSQWLAGVRDR